MPERCAIHSSVVSTILESSSLVRIRAGSAPPTPRTQERRVDDVIRRWVPASGADSLRRGCGRADVVGLSDHFPNLAEQFLAHHVIAELNGAGVGVGLRPAMGL